MCILCYVDDLTVMCRRPEKQCGDVNDLNKEVEEKPLGHIYYYFGIEIKKQKKTKVECACSVKNKR